MVFLLEIVVDSISTQDVTYFHYTTGSWKLEEGFPYNNVDFEACYDINGLTFLSSYQRKFNKF